MLKFVRFVTWSVLPYIRKSEERRCARIGPVSYDNISSLSECDNVLLVHSYFDELSDVEGAFISPSDIADHITIPRNSKPIKWFSRLQSKKSKDGEHMRVDDEPTGAITETARIGGVLCYFNESNVPFSWTSKCRVLDDSHWFA